MRQKRRFLWSWFPETLKEASEAIVENFLLHGFPARVSKKGLGFWATCWLGTLTWILFIILVLTGIPLMFLYIPSVERAYHTVKDIEYVVTYGSVLRSMHRIAAHGMVALAFLHLMRVWYMKAYQSADPLQGRRHWNWWIGIILLLCTTFLSYTGYLLPWDQLAFWAVTIGANIAKSVPAIGDQIYEFLVGGTELGQNTLIRFYVLHCVALPLVLVIAFAFHMWRIRKDGGLAVLERLKSNREVEQPVFSPTKTYTLLGVREGSIRFRDYGLPPEETGPAVQELIPRLLFWFVIVSAVIFWLALYIRAPLEPPANPDHPPNPAKAPWYFLWLQELIALTTIKIGGFVINGGFVGGVLIPALALLLLALWPLVDRSPKEAIGVWFHRSRWKQNLIFTLLVLGLLWLTVSGYFFRGPFWRFYWPGEPWPEMPTMF